jgi:hypothetical protein
MRQSQIRYRWFLVIGGCAAVVGFLQSTPVVQAQPGARAQVRLMFMFQVPGQEPNQAVETALISKFQGYGYSVLDAGTVAQTLHRHVDLLQLYDVEAAKRLGGRLGADIVISGVSKTRVLDKTYEMLGGKKVTVSQADVSAKAVLVSSGKVLAAENATARQPFDNTGDGALQKAAEAMADKLQQGIERFFSRDTVDYQLFILNVSSQQSSDLQNAMRQRVPGVRQVRERGFIKNTLELEVSVERQQDVTFKGNVPAQLAGLGLGRFEMVAREGEIIYLRRVGDASSSVASVESRESRESRSQNPSLQPAPGPQQSTTMRAETQTEAPSPSAPSLTPTYQRGYGKSWAVVIGINAYQKWPKLTYAVNDARAIGDLLHKIGFDEVIMLLDSEATQQTILRVLGDDLYAKTQDEDRVFIFFAGHGQTQDLPNNSKVGYIIPVEGEMNNYYSTAISMHQLQELSDRLRAKHMFFAMDSCFSGLLLRLRGIPDAYAGMEQTTARVRQVLTAGSEGEQVAEVEGHGLFTKMLIAGLQGAADLNQDKHITATELYQFLSRRVLEESRNTQNPVFGRLGTGQGEFIF